MLKNRREAGILLAQKLKRYRKTNSIILAIPRGGVVVGRVIADELSLPIDVIVTRKIGHPSNPEYAIGAVDATGIPVWNEMEVSSLDKQWVKEEVERQKEEAKRRNKIYRKGKKGINISAKIVIIVDDGIATGFTMQLAVRVVKKENPDKIIVAVPVASLESINQIRNEGADEIILLEMPEEFLGSVGAHYKEFEQIKDKEVIGLLNSRIRDFK